MGKGILRFGAQFTGIFKQLKPELKHLSMTVRFRPSIRKFEETIERPDSCMNLFIDGHKLRGCLASLAL